MLEECLLEKRKVQLSDVGELQIPYEVAATKRKIERTFQFKLNEVMMDENQRLSLKIDRLEHMRRLQELRIGELEAQVGRLEERLEQL